MRNFLLGVVFTIVALVVLLKVGTPLVAQQDRIQLHATGGDTNVYSGRVEAFCDSGNGTMIYSVISRTGTGVAIQINGCPKK